MLDNFGRPIWDDYYLGLAFLVATRSIDPRTKHGCVIVSKENRVLTMGYNGPIRGIDNASVPLTAPAKYPHLLHSEENALLSYNGSLQDIQGSIAYITGDPCHRCLRMLIQKGVTRVVHGHVRSVMLETAEASENEAKRLMIDGSHIKMVPHSCPADVRQVMEHAIKYFDAKNV
jgi:dCMP deaminase